MRLARSWLVVLIIIKWWIQDLVYGTTQQNPSHFGSIQTTQNNLFKTTKNNLLIQDLFLNLNAVICMISTLLHHWEIKIIWSHSLMTVLGFSSVFA